jgi:hypothetical protein
MMGRLVVVDGAVLRCLAGSEPSLLDVTTSFTQPVDGKSVATINDNQPGANFRYFGDCAITGKRCAPDISGPWQSGESSILLPTLLPILSADSLLSCAVGSEIVVENPGQGFFTVDSPEGGGEVPSWDAEHVPEWLRNLDGWKLALTVAGDLSEALKHFGHTREEALRRTARNKRRAGKKMSQRGGPGARNRREKLKRGRMKEQFKSGAARDAERAGGAKAVGRRAGWANRAITGGRVVNDLRHGHVGDAAVDLGEAGGASLGTAGCVALAEFATGGTVGLLGSGLCSATAGNLGGRVGGAVTDVAVRKGPSFIKRQVGSIGRGLSRLGHPF